jgi:nucleotide-binding universal stress UspA family protein
VINRIVIPLDRSTLSESVVPFGVLLARTLGSSIDFVHVIDKDTVSKMADAERYLARIVERFPPPAGHRSLIRAGDPAEAILDVAGDSGTMVVMATHGYTGLRRMILGSVADAVVRHARVPIALVRGDRKFRLPEETFRRLLVPLDGSQRSLHALPLAFAIAQPSEAKLDLLHVIVPVSMGEYGAAGIDPGYVPPEVYASMMDDLEVVAREDLETAASACVQAGIDADIHSPFGTPADSIYHLAEDAHADLIVMSTHGRGGASRVLMGSVATAIIHRSLVPVIVVPASYAEDEPGGATPDTARQDASIEV